MKKLYTANFNGTFCFVVDTEKVTSEDKIFSEACKYRPGERVAVCIGDATEIKSVDEIPPGWWYEHPYGVLEVCGETRDCASFLENRDRATSISDRLKALNYDLEPTFIEDLQKILSEESV